MVLVGCVKYKAMAVDCVSIAMIKWLAALDLTLALFYMIPVLTTLICQQWVLGNLPVEILF